MPVETRSMFSENITFVRELGVQLLIIISQVFLASKHVEVLVMRMQCGTPTSARSSFEALPGDERKLRRTVVLFP